MKKFKPLRDKYLIHTQYTTEVSRKLREEVYEMFQKYSGPGKLNPYDLADLVQHLIDFRAAMEVSRWRMKAMK